MKKNSKILSDLSSRIRNRKSIIFIGWIVIPLWTGEGLGHFISLLSIRGNIKAHQKSQLSLNLFFKLSSNIIITYLPASVKPKFPLILETTLYMPAFIFFGTPRVKSTIPQHLSFFPYRPLCIALTLTLFWNIFWIFRYTTNKRHISLCWLSNTLPGIPIFHVC